MFDVVKQNSFVNVCRELEAKLRCGLVWEYERTIKIVSQKDGYIYILYR